MKEETKNIIIETVKNLLEKVGFTGEVKLKENNPEFVTVSVDSESESGILIGKNGQNLNALDHIARLLVNKKIGFGIGSDNEDQGNFVLDINDYRKLRSNYLVEGALAAAKRVKETQVAEALFPMNAYERRMVHMELAALKEIETESIGQEPHRRIVIKPQVGII
ncbi:MAG TPA: R3H domain-containing nucleic acid-binding protein [Candidatus Paceibacterota bacterium]